MALVKMSKKVAGRVFGRPAVPLIVDGKEVVRNGKTVMTNPEIEFEGLAEDSTSEEVMTAFGGNAESIRKALIAAYNDKQLAAARDPFAEFIPDDLTEDESDALKTAAQNLVKGLGFTVEKAVKTILAARS